jgi:hypothetical protein
MHVWQISSFGIDSLEFVERPTPLIQAPEKCWSAFMQFRLTIVIY